MGIRDLPAEACYSCGSLLCNGCAIKPVRAALLELILDIRIKIASYDASAFYWMYRYDDEFKKYAHTIEGVKSYVSLAVVKNITNGYISYRIFDIAHSMFDEPSIIANNGIKAWYKNGLLHRANNMPAIIWHDGTEEYWMDGFKTNTRTS
jgi:hypothetical protein